MADDSDSADEAAARAACERVLEAVREACDATAKVADEDRAHAAAKHLVEILRTATNVAGLNHARRAARIQQLHDLSYSALGARLGVSKARAEQLVKSARRDGGEAGECPAP